MNNVTRGQTLFIVEGHHEKNELFKLIIEVFPELSITEENIHIFGTNIYQLYNKIREVYGEEWDYPYNDVDLPFVLNQSDPERFGSIGRKRNYKNIFLIFDYEGQDPNFSIDKIQQLQKYFSDVTNNGQLYINYPMVESYFDLEIDKDLEFLNKSLEKIMTGKEYKDIVKKKELYKVFQVPFIIPKRLERILGSSAILQHDTVSKILNCCSSESLKEICNELNIDDKKKENLNYYLDKNFETYFNNEISYNIYIKILLKRIVKLQILKYNRIITYPCSTHILSEQECDNLQQTNEFDYLKLLTLQNEMSSTDKLWIINTFLLFIAEYNPTLLDD
ncbi:hypothetical protein [Streptococcus oralis]|jgi:hypothetical protein|uniref:Uncharacterized protein n=1 Tax=Streptococcus oralis TaxID=1303 RepID=A0A4Q2FLU3_STROR|nr:hypothetical protein [Streptococcus oralis]RXX20016.1 hypothetical protein DF216_09235 [Streptococcus oralis]